MLDLFLLGQSFDDFLLLGLEPLFPALLSSLGLRPAGLSLVSQKLRASLVHLQLVDVFHENPLALNTLPFTFRSRLWYMWPSIFLDSGYLLSSR